MSLKYVHDLYGQLSSWLSAKMGQTASMATDPSPTFTFPTPDLDGTYTLIMHAPGSYDLPFVLPSHIGTALHSHASSGLGYTSPPTERFSCSGDVSTSAVLRLDRKDKDTFVNICKTTYADAAKQAVVTEGPEAWRSHAWIDCLRSSAFPTGMYASRTVTISEAHPGPSSQLAPLAPLAPLQPVLGQLAAAATLSATFHLADRDCLIR
ncbi:uncharacterized protein MKK02DRAFT_32214 [Dioszegia hungarica]|uniref:Uncharacterized protein n=1 Tax=Dioszegia hungarica TaxID=4972 RepID=A0AA38HBU9_9TREE|nr:uncharacterized protein MKK02DRAFT_32214 [Dioszegia hungarica]KAI9637340.1 hypothetical protein MKK02DRAFT_32214 [Dioszegia hungarica]